MAAMMASVGAGLFAMLAMLSKPEAQRSLAFLLAFGEKLQRGVVLRHNPSPPRPAQLSYLCLPIAFFAGWMVQCTQRTISSE